jgi:four helix bundle protein
VVEGFPPPIGDAVINDGPGLLLIVIKQPEGNTLEVTRNVEAVLEALKPGLKDVDIDSTIFRPATFIEVALRNLNCALLIGCILVIAVLPVFLFEWRTTLNSLLAIPLSLISAAMVLHYRGFSINTMVIAGLVIALGEVVDDAIIDVENIMRRLRINRTLARPESAFQVVLKASVEVRSAIVYATLIVVMVFIPVFFLEGLSGSFFRPLAISYVLAVMASLGVALTLTPALSLLLLPRAAASSPKEPPITRMLKRAYLAVLPGLVRRPAVAVLLCVAVLAATVATVPFLGEEFLPNFKEQLLRASQSIPLNIAEGDGKPTEGERRRFFEIARGSTLEGAAIQDVLEVCGALSPSENANAKKLLDRMVAMLTRLGQRGYSVREGPDVCGSDDVESDFDSDSDTDSDNDFKSAG